MMKLPDPNDLARLVTKRYGIAFRAEIGENAEGTYYDFSPEDLHENVGFFIRTIIGWRSIQAWLQIGAYGGDVLMAMSQSSEEQRSAFISVANLLNDEGGRVHLRINGTEADPFSPRDWAQSWKNIEVGVERSPLMLDHDDESELKRTVLFWGGGVLGMVVSLLPTIEVETETNRNVEGLPEGAQYRVYVNRYERNRLNRALCISIHGNRCKVCDMLFEEQYGEIGCDFIHVHHVTPISRLGDGYTIDPIKDLVPVCPNCHAMMHVNDPPFTVAELRKKYNRNRGDS